MNRFKRSWLLLKSSMQVIARNKLLLVFPLVTFVCMIVIVLFFIAPAALRPTGYSYFDPHHWQAIGNSLFTETADASGAQGAPGAHHNNVAFTPGAIAYLVVVYFAAMFFATFFNVAFFNEILVALTGQPISIGRGLKFACSRWKAILMWTLFAGVIGLIIKTIEQRMELVGRIIARLIGVAWSIASVFVIPIIVREDVANPVKLLKTSGGLLKRTWGEGLIGYAGLALGNLIVTLVSLAFLFGALVISMALHNYVFMVAGVFFWVVAMFAWSYLTGVAGQVYKGALYLYAAEGRVYEPYDKEMLDAAWKFKKR